MKNSGDFSNFSKILKTLEMENVSLPELKLLKQQHAYLQKLRQQRSKVIHSDIGQIEQLKAKYDQIQGQLQNVNQENRNLKSMLQINIKDLVDDQSRTIILLENQIEQQQNKIKALQNSINLQLCSERDRSRIKLSEISHQNEQLKKLIKQKGIELFSIEQQFNQKLLTMKDNFMQERKKIITEYQNRIKSQANQKNQQEIHQLRNFIERQNKALQMQNNQYETLLEKYTTLTEESENTQQQIQKIINDNQSYQQKIQELNEHIQMLENKIEQYEQESLTKYQLEEIRNKMSQLTKGQIERIQFIVNQFE